MQTRVNTHSTTLTADVASLWSYLVRERPGQLFLLLGLIVLAALMEMAVLAALVPLINVLMDSQIATQSSGESVSSGPISFIQTSLSQSQILGIVVVVVSISAVLRIMVVRLSTGFSLNVGMQLQTEYINTILNREYEQVVNQPSSENVSFITQKIQMVISNYILGVLTMLSALVSGIGVAVILIWLSTSIVLLALVALAACYVVIAAFTRNRLKRYGRDLQVYNPKKVQSLQEGLGGIRDVVMAGSQEQFVNRFANAARRVEVANARIVFYNALPRPMLEAIGICSIAGIAWSVQKGYFSSIDLLPLLGVFALGMLRLLPYMQHIFGQWTRLVHGHPILAELVGELNGFTKLVPHENTNDTEILPFQSTIAFRQVGFKYVGAESSVLNGINLSIKKGEYIGIVGPTGSGKSTLVDMLMGLLPPTEGAVVIDDVTLTKNNRALWRKRVAHVPQKLFLTQASIAENIAFGLPISSIDKTRVEECARHANLHDYIQTLAEGYDTLVGEDGVRLSGGQRQRIGLARALYSNCDVLVLDEATNALDNATEQAVIDRLLSLDRGYTLIIIAHNLRTVTHCHRILLVGSGAVQWQS